MIILYSIKTQIYKIKINITTFYPVIKLSTGLVDNPVKSCLHFTPAETSVKFYNQPSCPQGCAQPTGYL